MVTSAGYGERTVTCSVTNKEVNHKVAALPLRLQEFSTKFAPYASVLSTPLALNTLLTYLRVIHLLATSALQLTLVHCAFLQYTQKAMANVPFHTLHLLSGTIFLKLLETQNLLFLSNQSENLSVSSL